MRVMQILSLATNVIAEGEVQQLCNLRNPDTTEAEYLEVISRKTAMLFQAASHSGAVLAGADAATETALKNYGLHLGVAFQLIDDHLDYQGDTLELGKNVGDDLAEGKVTLPLIVAMREGNPAQQKTVREAILSGGSAELEQIVSIVRDTGGLAYTRDMAEQERQNALTCLSEVADSSYSAAMQALINFAVDRRH